MGHLKSRCRWGVMGSQLTRRVCLVISRTKSLAVSRWWRSSILFNGIDECPSPYCALMYVIPLGSLNPLYHICDPPLTFSPILSIHTYHNFKWEVRCSINVTFSVLTNTMQLLIACRRKYTEVYIARCRCVSVPWLPGVGPAVSDYGGDVPSYMAMTLPYDRTFPRSLIAPSWYNGDYTNLKWLHLSLPRNIPPYRFSDTSFLCCPPQHQPSHTRLSSSYLYHQPIYYSSTIIASKPQQQIVASTCFSSSLVNKNLVTTGLVYSLGYWRVSGALVLWYGHVL